MRGRLVGSFQINIVIGILLAYLSNYAIARLGLGAAEWRWQFGVAAFPAVLCLEVGFAIPPSPPPLGTRDRADEARAFLQVSGPEEPRCDPRGHVRSVHPERVP